MNATQISKNTGIDSKLVKRVINQIGDIDSLQDVARHGADGGFPGFTYYSDTVKFFKANRAAIVEMVERMADELGEEPLAMVAGFNCLKPADSDTRRSVARCLYGRITDEDTNVANALAWFALEEVARGTEQ